MILDTCFIIDLLNNDPSALKKSQDIDKQHTPVATTAISVFEIWQGVADINDKEKLARINDLLESLGLFSLDQESAKIAGKIHSKLYTKGTPIQPEDSMIAGICLKNNITILTRNVKHFSRVDNLVLETY